MIVIDNPVFGEVFIFSIGGNSLTFKELKSCLKKNGLTHSDEDVRAIVEGAKIDRSNNKAATTYANLHAIKVVRFHYWENKAVNYGTLAHEIFHCVDLMLRAKGFTLSDDSDEAYAYCIGHLTREVLNKIWQE